MTVQVWRVTDAYLFHFTLLFTTPQTSAVQDARESSAISGSDAMAITSKVTFLHIMYAQCSQRKFAAGQCATL
jgi:hypothetical protein